jgi:hypothetical protein
VRAASISAAVGETTGSRITLLSVVNDRLKSGRQLLNV